MKLTSIDESYILIDQYLSEARGGSPDLDLFADQAGQQDIEQSYKQLETLEDVFATGNFGVLIGRQPGQIHESDIPAIKNALLVMLVNNKFFSGINFKGNNGVENLRLMRAIGGHAIETVLLAAVTGLLAFVTGEEALHGDEVLPVLTGLGAVAGLYGLRVQIRSIRALWAAYKFQRMLVLYQRYTQYTPGTYRRTMLRRFLDFVEGKTPMEAREQIIQQVKNESAKREAKFESSMRNFPQYIIVKTSNGGDAKYPTENFLDFNG